MGKLTSYSRIDKLAKLIYNNDKQLRCERRVCENYSWQKDDSNFAKVNLKSGAQSVIKDGEAISFSGGPLNTNPNTCYIGISIYSRPKTFENQTSHIWLEYAETKEVLTSKLMTHTDNVICKLYFKKTTKKTIAGEVIVGDRYTIAKNILKISLSDFFKIILQFGDYPLGVINHQKVSDKSSTKSNIHQNQKRLALLARANLLKTA